METATYPSSVVEVAKQFVEHNDWCRVADRGGGQVVTGPGAVVCGVDVLVE
jgi:hypothetical protein